MTANPRLQETLASWLEEDAPAHIPDGVLAAVFTRTRSSRQRAGRRTLLNRRPMPRFAAALAGAFILLLGGVLVLTQVSRLGFGGRGQPSPSATPDGSLPQGSFRLWSGQGAGTRIDVTIPAAGWFAPDDGFLLKNGNQVEPDAAGLLVFAEASGGSGVQGDVYVYADACHWSSSKPARPIATLDEAVAAFTDQAGHDASSAVDVVVGGHPGKSLTLEFPKALQPDRCDEGEVRILVEGSRERAGQAPGMIEELWIVDAGGATDLVIFDLVYDAGVPQVVIDEMRAMVRTATFD